MHAIKKNEVLSLIFETGLGEKEDIGYIWDTTVQIFKHLGDGCLWSENWKSGYDVVGRGLLAYSLVVYFGFFHMCACMTKKKKTKPEDNWILNAVGGELFWRCI